MESKKLKFAVICGDMRQTYLARSLREDGHIVYTLGLEDGSCDSLREAVRDADCVVLPVPSFGDDSVRLIRCPSGCVYSLGELLSALEPGQLAAGGRIEKEVADSFTARGIEIVDYTKREDLAAANAVPTAEGAIQLAMEGLPVTLSGCPTLLTGLGRIGMLLAARLTAMGARLTAAARSERSRRMAEAFGITAVNTAELTDLGRFQLVINTVPAPIFGRKELAELRADCLCIDLASKPGGFDFVSAAELGVKVQHALSLPGRVAPLTSGKIIKEVVYNILRERGVFVGRAAPRARDGGSDG